MKIRDMIGQGKPTLSFEVFPPKTEANYESVENDQYVCAAVWQQELLDIF